MRRRLRTPGTGASTRHQTLALGACALVGVLLAATPGYAAQPSQEPGESPAPESEVQVPEPVPGESVCAIVDPRLHSVSGMVATDDGYVVVNDSQLDDTLRPIFFLDSTCAVVDELSFFPGQPRDPEDMEFDPDSGVLWIGDIGDNQAAGTNEGAPREWITLWRVDLTGGDRTPVVHRFVYPDGQPRDAEALLLTADGDPLIVTKSVGTAELFVASDLQPDNPPEAAVSLEAVGEFNPPDTGSDNRFGAAGRQVITGGAVAPDRSRVALRTYADAFEFDVPDGDVVAAITEGAPRVTPLPDEPQGEVITYTPDGAEFLTVSELPDDVADYTPTILRYQPTEPAPEPTAAAEEPAESETGGGGFSLVNSVQDIINLVAAVGVLGLLLVTAGVIGIVRARRRAAGAASRSGDGDDDDPDDAQAAPVRGRARLMGDEAEQGWEPGQGAHPAAAQASVPATAAAQAAAPAPAQAAGVYTSRAVAPATPAPQDPPSPAGTEYGSSHAGTTYGAAEPGGEFPGNEYGGRDQRGTEYGADRGPGREYGQRPATGQEYGAPAYGEPGVDAGHGGHEYGGHEYGAAEYGATDNGAEYGGSYRGGGDYPAHDHYQANQYRGGEYADYRGGYPAGDYPPPEPGRDYRGAGYGGDGYRAGADPQGYPAGGYPADAHPADGYPADRYPAGGYPADRYSADGYPADGYRGNDYPERGYSGADDYRREYGNGEYPAGQGGAGYGHVPGPRSGERYGPDDAGSGWSGQEGRGSYDDPDYEGRGYGDRGYDGRYDDYDYSQQPAGGARGHGAHAAQSDYYSDDPDYPYEFRQPGRY